MRPWSTGGWFRMKQTTSDNLTVYFHNIIKIFIYIYTCQKLSRQETPNSVGGKKIMYYIMLMMMLILVMMLMVMRC